MYEPNHEQPPVYPPQGMPVQKNKTVTALAVVLSITGALLLCIILVAVLFMTGTIKLGGDDSENPTVLEIQTEKSDTVSSEESGVVSQVMFVSNVPNSIYFRSTPDEQSDNIITTISRGTAVTFLKNANTVFAEISYNGQTGYVKREYLSATQPSPSYESANTGDTTVKSYMYVANVENSIYLRSSPKEVSGNVICTIPVGTSVGYISTTGNFCKINYNGTIGYAKSKYLENEYYPYTDYLMEVYNVPNSIYLRSEPYEDASNVICQIPVGSYVTYINNGNGTFYYIEWNGYRGYAKAKYLR